MSNNMNNNSLFVRIKREQKTIFFVCLPSDTVESLKVQIKNFFDKLELSEMRLYLLDRVH